MRKTNQAGYLMRHRGWWVLRYRERVGVGGKIKTVQRAKRLVPVDAEHKTRASVRDLAKRELEPLNRNLAEPLSVTKVGDFLDRVYLQFATQQKRPSTYVKGGLKVGRRSGRRVGHYAFPERSIPS